MRGRLDDAVLDGVTLRRYLKVDSDIRTLAGTVTIVDESPTFLQYDAGGSSRNVDFPTRALANDGQIRFVSNISTAGENLTIRNAAATTLLTLPAGGLAIVFAFGSSEAPGTRGWLAVPIGGEDLALADDLTVSGDLAVTSTATLSSTLGVGKTASFSSNIAVASTVDAQAVFSAKTPTLGKATSDVVGFYGGTGSSQRASSNQASTNAAVSASFGATQLAILQEIMNTLTAASIWKGAA